MCVSLRIITDCVAARRVMFCAHLRCRRPARQTQGPSMLPTLNEMGDIVIVDRLVWDPIQRNDIVIAESLNRCVEGRRSWAVRGATVSRCAGGPPRIAPASTTGRGRMCASASSGFLATSSTPRLRGRNLSWCVGRPREGVEAPPLEQHPSVLAARAHPTRRCPTVTCGWRETTRKTAWVRA